MPDGRVGSPGKRLPSEENDFVRHKRALAREAGSPQYATRSVHRPLRAVSRRWARRGLAVAGSVALLSAVGYAVAPSVQAEGTIRPAGSLVNYFFAHNTTPNSFISTETSVLADPVNHTMYQFNGQGGCPDLVSMDPDTYAVLTTNGRVANGVCSVTADFDVPAPVGGTQPPTLVYDSTDGLLVGASQLANAVQGNKVVALSEKSLDLAATWSLPTDVHENYISGISWYAPLDEIIVLSSFGNTAKSFGAVPPGVAVVAIDVKASLAAGKLVAAWEEPDVSGCQYSLIPTYGTAAPYHAAHDNAVFVPCQLSHLGTNGSASVERDGMVRIPLTMSGCGAGTPECVDSAATLASAAAPGRSDDVYFDPAIDRAFMPYSQTAGLAALIYDGKDRQFEGQTSLGSLVECDASTGTQTPFGSQIGLDPVTGRVYAATGAGLISVEGRETPLSPGDVFQQYKSQVPNGTTVVLPPDSRYPYTRLLVSHVIDYCSQSSYEPDFTVYVDSRPVPPPREKTEIDRNTYQGTLAPGTQLSTTYGATGRGFGAHVDLVSSIDGPVSNLLTTSVNGLPFGAGNRDLLVGDVTHLALNDGTAQGAATAVGDGNGTTSADLHACTNFNAVGNCASLVRPPDLPTSGSAPTAPPTAQLWPSPLSSCSYPGTGGASQHYDGLYATSYTQPSPSPDSTETPSPTPTQSVVPNTEATAHSDVNCVGDPSQRNRIVASASAQAVDSTVGLSFSVGTTTSSVAITPPDGTAHTVRTEANAVAKDVALVSSDGTELLRIGEIDHTATAQASGVKGGAATTNVVTMKNVYIKGSEICTNQCDPAQVLEQLNASFPTLLFASQPQPATPYGVGANGAPHGSPGGYQAVVQSNPTELYGDEQFNGMNAEEASELPALRIILYGFRDGDPNESRLVGDFAGLEVDAQLGVQPASDLSPPPPPIDTTAASLAATGLPLPPSEAGGVLEPAPQTIVDVPVSSPPLGYIVRAFRGLNWLMRSPLAAVQMAAFLALLGLPMIMMRRRGAASDGETA